MAANRTPEAEPETAAAPATTDAGLVKWILVATTLSLLVANYLLYVVELGKYSA